MFDEKIIHPNMTTVFSYIATLNLDDLVTLKNYIIKIENELVEESAKKSLTTFGDITSGSILIVKPLKIDCKLHCVVLSAAKYAKEEGFRVWYLNEKVEDIKISHVVKHEVEEAYVPLQLRPDQGKRDRLPLSKAKDDLRKKYAEEYNGLMKGE